MNANAGPQWANPNAGAAPPGNATINASQQESDFFAPLSTLDEPVRETIMRDVQAVVSKLKVVMLPIDRNVPVRREGVNLTRVIVLCEEGD